MASVSAQQQFIRAVIAAADGGIGKNTELPFLKAERKRLGLPAAIDRVLDSVAQPEPLGRRVSMGSGSRWAVEVVSFQPGAGGGFNAENKGVVLGQANGGGKAAGSLDVVSLGDGGSITLRLGRAATRGVIVFGNAFETNGQVLHAELGKVEVAATKDGPWYDLGVAGKTPVGFRAGSRMPIESAEAGGDYLPFAGKVPAGTQIRFVRITDLRTDTSAPVPGARTRGLDVDAVIGLT